MVPKLSSENISVALRHLDDLSNHIQQQYTKLGMSFEAAKPLVQEIDKIADFIEVNAFGEESFLKRRAEVIQKDSDEKYMTTFENPMQPHQTDADEKYMGAYKDDQSSAVHHGKSETGRPLAP
jgi:hypothetical protein